MLITIRLEILLYPNKIKLEQRRGKKRSPMIRKMKMGCGSSYVVSIGLTKVLCFIPDQNDIYLASGCSTSALQF